MIWVLNVTSREKGHTLSEYLFKTLCLSKVAAMLNLHEHNYYTEIYKNREQLTTLTWTSNFAAHFVAVLSIICWSFVSFCFFSYTCFPENFLLSCAVLLFPARRLETDFFFLNLKDVAKELGVWLTAGNLLRLLVYAVFNEVVLFSLQLVGIYKLPPALLMPCDIPRLQKPMCCRRRLSSASQSGLRLLLQLYSNDTAYFREAKPFFRWFCKVRKSYY